MIKRSKVVLGWFIVCMILIAAIAALVIFLQPEYVSNF